MSLLNLTGLGPAGHHPFDTTLGRQYVYNIAQKWHNVKGFMCLYGLNNKIHIFLRGGYFPPALTGGWGGAPRPRGPAGLP